MKRTLGLSLAGAVLAVAACSDGVGFSGPKEAERWGTVSRSQVQPDFTPGSWVGWTNLGNAKDNGIWAGGSQVNDFAIYTARFTATGSETIPAGVTGESVVSWNAGDEILAIGLESAIATATSQVFYKFDPNANSYQAASAFGGSGGRTSGGTWADSGDYTFQMNGDNNNRGKIRSSSYYGTRTQPQGTSGATIVCVQGDGNKGDLGKAPGWTTSYQSVDGTDKRVYVNLTTAECSDANGGPYKINIPGGTRVALNFLSMDAVVTLPTPVPPLPTYNLTGFFAPVDMGGVTNRAKAGQTIPLKFRVVDENGAPYGGLVLSNVAVTSIQTIAGSGTSDDIETYSGASGLQYLGDGNYQFNWKTPTSYANQTRNVRLTINDPDFLVAVNPTALFNFRK